MILMLIKNGVGSDLLCEICMCESKMEPISGGRENCTECRNEVVCFLVVLGATVLISSCVGRGTKQRIIISWHCS